MKKTKVFVKYTCTRCGSGVERGVDIPRIMDCVDDECDGFLMLVESNFQPIIKENKNKIKRFKGYTNE